MWCVSVSRVLVGTGPRRHGHCVRASRSSVPRAAAPRLTSPLTQPREQGHHVFIYIRRGRSKLARICCQARPPRRCAARGPQLVLNILLSVQPCVRWILSIIAASRLGAWGRGLGTQGLRPGFLGLYLAARGCSLDTQDCSLYGMGLQPLRHRVAASTAQGCSLYGMGLQPLRHGVAARRPSSSS